MKVSDEKASSDGQAGARTREFERSTAQRKAAIIREVLKGQIEAGPLSWIGLDWTSGRGALASLVLDGREIAES